MSLIKVDSGSRILTLSVGDNTLLILLLEMPNINISIGGIGTNIGISVIGKEYNPNQYYICSNNIDNISKTC